ncbi:MAG: hypothetical protein B6244_08615 [Candidatus Cloacimonetes bacterium 4572_55]|nr:MAG: hypothetical protein B6244_08615 [Candidatus Cloacimonetes bacterium 4572_55]
MVGKVAGANSMVKYHGKMIQIQSQFTHPNVVTVIIMNGQVKKRYETDVAKELAQGDSTKLIQRILHNQHKEVELKIRAKKRQYMSKNTSSDVEEEEVNLPEEPKEDEKPKKRGFFDILFRRKKG